MGICKSRQKIPQILVLGPQGSGKTTLVYGDRYDQFEPTTSFNYEEIQLRGYLKVGMWDVSGKQSLRCLWPSYYKSIPFDAIVYVIAAEREEYFQDARRELHVLVNEEELRECIFLIIFNVTTDKNYELSELKTRMDIELIHSSVTKECFVVDLMTDDGMFDEAMKWLAEAIIERL